MTAKSIDDIMQGAEELADAIREYSRSQKELWRQVPYLALQADGGLAYSRCYHNAYTDGYWTVDCTLRNGVYNVIVDLESGELMDVHEVERDPAKDARPRKADTRDLLTLAFRMHEIDAKRILKSLKKESAYNARCRTRKKDAAWRAKIIREQGLEKKYTRTQKQAKRLSRIDD